ncbi:MAG: hypothetical protein JWM16_5753 [Verrucomicrobiales bacterium]|nr:hypothetical protein [Verrucomicrobiales bacterium]
MDFRNEQPLSDRASVPRHTGGMDETDLELLARYDRDKTEDAFAELVRRHVDRIYSAASEWFTINTWPKM